MQKNHSIAPLILLLASTLIIMANACISPALPKIQEHFAAEPYADTLSKLVLTFPALFIVLSAPFMGKFARLIGKKPLLILATVFFALAGVSGVLAESLSVMLIGRACLGIAVGAIMTMTTTLIADLLEGEERTKTLGLQAAFASAGGIIFLVLAGALADISWQAPFYAYLLGVLLLPAMLLYLPKRTNDNNETVEKESNEMKNRLLPIYVIAFLSQVGFYLVPTNISYYLYDFFSLGGFEAGLAIATAAFFSTVSSLRYKLLKEYIHRSYIAVAGFILMGVSYVMLGSISNIMLVYFSLSFTGLGLGLLMPVLTDWVTTNSDSVSRASAVGGLTAAIFLGQFISPLISQLVKSVSSFPDTFLFFGAVLVSVGVFINILNSRIFINRELLSSAKN